MAVVMNRFCSLVLRSFRESVSAAMYLLHIFKGGHDPNPSMYYALVKANGEHFTFVVTV